jgi:serine/threonine protein kinase
MTDYQDAVQNPKSVFSEKDLQGGVPVYNALGLPRPITGGFATVYQIVSGGHKWAVRCFLRYYPDMELRYAAISKHLRKCRLPYTTEFYFLNEGIRILGQWYPILKMEWIDGEPLNTYIEKNLNNPHLLNDLATEFFKMSKDLKRHSIAHGDLQHGNILVENGKLRLVDYDGMYVPALKDLSSHEIGHPNYQHPKRSQRDYGLYLDTFSEWVIMGSVLALTVKPDLWSLAKGGDERLLFSQHDFRNPSSSKVLELMRTSDHEMLRNLARAIIDMLKEDNLARLSELSDLRVPYKIQVTRIVIPVSVGSKVLNWLKNFRKAVFKNYELKNGRETKANCDKPDSVMVKVDGVYRLFRVSRDFGTKKGKIGKSFWAERGLVAAYVVLTGGSMRYASIGVINWDLFYWISGSTLLLLVGILGHHYRSLPESVSLSRLKRALNTAKEEISKIEQSMTKMERKKEELLQVEQKETTDMTTRIRQLDEHRNRDLESLDFWLHSEIEKENRYIEFLSRLEAEEIQTALLESPGLPFRKRMSEIVQQYRAKREPFLTRQARAREKAHRKREMLTEKYWRKREVLLEQFQEVKTRFEEELRNLKDNIQERQKTLLYYRNLVSSLSKDISAYSEVTFLKYLQKVFFLYK